MPESRLLRTTSNRMRDILLASVLLFLIAQNGWPALAAGRSDPSTPQAALQGQPFTFQGRLTEDGLPVDGNYDFEFSLFDVAVDGVPLNTMPIVTNLPVVNGMFGVLLDFGPGQFAGERRWVQVRSRRAGSGAFSVLGRQELAATPYALYALNIPEHSHLGETWVDGFGLGPITFGADGVNEPAITLFHNALALSSESITGDAVMGTAYTAGKSGIVGVSSVIVGCGVATPCYGVHGVGPDLPASAGVLGEGKEGVRGESLEAACPTSGTVASDFCVGLRGVAMGNASAGVWGEGQKFGVVGKVVSPLQSESAGIFGIQGDGQWAGRFLGNVKVEGAGSHIDFGITTRQMLNLWSTNFAIGVQSAQLYQRTGGGFAWFLNGVHSDTTNDPGFGGTRQMRLDGGGNLFVRGAVSTGGADFAELVSGSGELEAGDVLVIGASGVMERSLLANDTRVAGVYSTKPGVLGGGDIDTETDARIPLAVTGIVPVKVSGEGGPIRPGDLLVASSAPGHAMRGPANPAAGTVVGKALDSFEGEFGTVSVLLDD